MKKTLFSVAVVFLLAALGAVALTTRPEPAASTSSGSEQLGQDVDTRVVERTVRIKRRAEAGDDAALAGYAVSPAAAGAVSAAPRASGLNDGSVEPREAGDDDDHERHEAAEFEDHDSAETHGDDGGEDGGEREEDRHGDDD